MLLDIRDLKVYYGKVEAVKGISLQVEAGNIVTLLGSNGAGKSTILKAICGLKRPASGEIWFQGRRIDGNSSSYIVSGGIGIVPERGRVFRDMSVYDNLLLGAYIRKDKDIKQDLQEMCRYFPILKERINQRAGTLSGGEQQMLAISRALMCKPRLLLLDEPSIGLSPLMVSQITSIIATINQQQGISVLLVEQNAAIALRLANWGYVIETGRIVLSGARNDLLNNDKVKKAYLGG